MKLLHDINELLCIDEMNVMVGRLCFNLFAARKKGYYFLGVVIVIGRCRGI